MEKRQSKHVNGVTYILTDNYVRVKGYGDGKPITYISIPEKTKGWLKVIQIELHEIYDEKVPEKICPICGKRFRNNRRELCSEDCSEIRRKEKASRTVEAECIICGKTFTKLRTSERETCGDECNRELRKAKAKGAWNDRMPTPKTGGKKQKKKKSQLAELNRQAREKGLSYGQLQAQKMLEKMRGE